MEGQKVIAEAVKQLKDRPPNDLAMEALRGEEKNSPWEDWEDGWVNWHDGPIFENWLNNDG